jgi:hypothetical protein
MTSEQNVQVVRRVFGAYNEVFRGADPAAFLHPLEPDVERTRRPRAGSRGLRGGAGAEIVCAQI